MWQQLFHWKKEGGGMKDETKDEGRRMNDERKLATGRFKEVNLGSVVLGRRGQI
jgi:hypothetical protein